MPASPSYCGYCGRISRRCVCHRAGSALQRFAQRGGQNAAPVQRGTPYKRGVPPQIKRAERRAQQRHYKIWYAALVETYGECCFNCGAADDLALDHVLPIAKGGRSALSNLQLLCAACNRLKGKLVIDCRARHPED